MKFDNPMFCNKKIRMYLGIICVAAAVFIIFVYLPLKKQITDQEYRLKLVNSQIAGIEKIIDNTKNPQDGIRMLQERLEKLDNRFSISENTAIENISRLAKEMNIEVISVAHQPRAVVLDNDSKNLMIESEPCSFIFVSLAIKCPYKDLVMYIQRLSGPESPVFATIEKLNISKNRLDITQRLDVALGLKLYFRGNN